MSRISYKILLLVHCAKYCLAYSIGGLSNKKIPNEIPINQNKSLNFWESDISPQIILSMTYRKISGINKGITYFKITIRIVPIICQIYGLTNFKYCLTLFIQSYFLLLFSSYSLLYAFNFSCEKFNSLLFIFLIFSSILFFIFFSILFIYF